MTKIFNLQAVECNIYVYSYLIFIRMILNMRVLTGFIFIIFLYYRIAILVFFFIIAMSFVAYSLCQGKTRLKMCFVVMVEHS